MTTTLRDRIAALAEAEPALAEIVRLRGTLIELIGRAALDVGELRLPADLVRARLAAGVPLLDRLDLPVPSATTQLVDHLAVAMLADPDLPHAAEALVIALRSHRLHAEQLVGESAVGHAEHLEALADAAGVSAVLASAVADLAARAVLEAVAARLRPALGLGAWARGFCPICGGRPIFGEADGSGGDQLRLRCGRCATPWAFERHACPDCAGTDFGFGEPARQTSANQATWGLLVCSTCSSYLKLRSDAGSESLADLLFDDLATWRLDHDAVEGGYERPGGVGHRLEHGEVGGEELGD